MMDLEGAKTIEGTQLFMRYSWPANDYITYPGCVAAVRDFILSHPDVKNDTSKFIEVSHQFYTRPQHYLIPLTGMGLGSYLMACGGVANCCM
jgi:hypothetical protein